MEGIVLKNIDLSGVSRIKQWIKVMEERAEFSEATGELLKGYEGSVEHSIEEFWDEVQANIGYLQLLDIPAERVMEGYQKHLKKMEIRGNKPRE